jgi:hypothetical protein
VLGWVAGFLIPTSIGMRLVAALAHVQHAPDE